MSDNKKSSNRQAGSRKRRNRKRQASSPLSDNGIPSTSIMCNTGERPNNNKGQKKSQVKKSRQECNVNSVGSVSQNQPTNPSYYGYNYINMAFQQQQPNFTTMTQHSFLQNSPPAHFGAKNIYTIRPPPSPWANELLADMKTIKTKLQTIDEEKADSQFHK